MRSIQRLAIVNRGGPAMRVLAAVAELNLSGKDPPITTIALPAEADGQAWFTRQADEAVSLGPATEVDPGDGRCPSRYLDERLLMAALRRARADAVWVGWGSLAEPASFAERCEEAGIVFVGPSSATMRVLGDKLAVRRVAEQAGVPVLPDSGDRAFGARRIEVQIIADHHGTTWAVDACDCTIARRGQTVLAESSSPALDPATERTLKEAAIRFATVAGYRNAGIVEFRYAPTSGSFHLVDLRPGSRVEHPVTEETTGLDLIKLQLHVARGGRLIGRPPRLRGHAIAAHLRAQDPENAFAPAPGRLAALDTPTGPGIRVDTGLRAGDMVGPRSDPIATIAAWGRDRNEARARLRRALALTTVVVEGGTTNRSFLLAVLDRAEVRDGDLDCDWLDRLTADGGHLPAADPVALLVAAVEAYESDQAVDRAAFHARAVRGRAGLPAEVGHACVLRYRGIPYRMRVFRTGPRTYQVDAGELAAIAVDRVSASKRMVEVAGRRHRVTTAVDGTTYRVEVDDRAHHITRDDGGIVRAAWPAFVVAVCVAPGDTVAGGDPLVVVESMKMESTITAPFGGDVAEIEVGANMQVDAGTPLMRIRARASTDGVASPAGALDLTGLAALEPADAPPCEQVYDALRNYLLGYDLDAVVRRDVLTRQRRLGEVSPPADPGLRRCEDGLLDLFADIGSLYRPRAADEDEDPLVSGSTQEYLLSYLQWLDPTRAGLPDRYRRRLEQALRRYGVPDLTRTPALEEAVVWMFRSFGRVEELVPVVTRILDRRLRQRAAWATAADLDVRARLDRLIAATQGRHQAVADLARDVRFTHLDEPLLEAAGRAEYAVVDGHLDALTVEPDRADRRERVARLVASPQPLRSTLLRRWLAQADERFRGVLLEVYTRRYYRIRDLRNVSCTRQGVHLLGTADYDLDGRSVHLVVAYVDLAKLTKLARAIAGYLSGVDPHCEAVIDVVAWRDGAALTGDLVAREVAQVLRSCDFGRPLRRLDVTVTSTEPTAPEHLRTRHVTFRQASDGTWSEERLYRDLHPMLAKRLDLWRLANFELERLPSAEDLYLFHGVAHDNPSDHRLFALAEVRDLTAVPGATSGAAGPATFPQLEYMGLRALSAMRRALAGFASDRDRPTSNRIVLYVRPPWSIPAEAWPALARSFAPLAVGAGLEKVVLRVRIPEPGGDSRDAVLHVEGLSRRGVTVRELPVGSEPIRPLTAYRQKVLRAERVGAPYPYEVVRMLAPPRGAMTRLPTGSFVEHDLDDAGQLVPTTRPPGHNTANIVAGLITNNTVKVPEGMTRVALLGDPTRGLGNLAEPECRRIIAAVDLAERLQIPLEWFALSSGARIAMDSGTENMDWIAAVLRRLIEFTQCGGEVNIIVTGVNVGAQPYWNAEATMLMHTRGILVMTPQSAMVLTGKQALDLSGGVSAEDNFGIGGFDRIMGPNGQGQYWAPTLDGACEILLAHYDHTYVVPGERCPRRAATIDPVDRDVRTAPHPTVDGSDLAAVGDLFSAEHNPNRKKPFAIRAIMHAVSDMDAQPLERWGHWRGAETVVVWDAHIGGFPVCLLGVESQAITRRGFVAADGPLSWTSGTLFPQSSRKLARAINAASGNRPVVVLANLSGFDGSPESMRHWQLEYGGEIGRAVTNFRGPIVFVVVSRYHGGAFVVFSKRLNEHMEIAAVEGSYASVIGGAPAAATVFAREVKTRTEQDPRVISLRAELDAGPAGSPPPESDARRQRARLAEITAGVRSEKLGEVAAEFDQIHTIQRAQAVGSVDRIIAARELRPYLIDAVRRGMARYDASAVMTAAVGVGPVRPPADGPATNGEARRRRVAPDPPRRPEAASAPRRRR